jgi:hypothetical protein
MKKLVIKKVDEKNISIEDLTTSVEKFWRASLRAEGNAFNGMISIYDESHKLVYYAYYSDIEVDEFGILGSVQETVQALNGFIGNFRFGGSSSSTTEAEVVSILEDYLQDVEFVFTPEEI